MEKTQNLNRINVKIITALTLVHFTGDLFSSFISPLIPVFVEKLSLSMAQVGILTGVMRLLAFIVQPTVGYLADRYQTRAFIITGLLLSIIFIPLSCTAGSFYMLLGMVALGSLGSSMFHPSVTGMVPLYSGNKKSFCMSIFNTGGTLSFAIGPVFITFYVAQFGLNNVPYTMLIGFAVLIVCLMNVPVPISEGMKSTGFIGSLKESLGHVWKAIFLIWLVMVLRAIVGQSFFTFMPVLLSHKGYSLVMIGMIISALISAGTISGLISGYLADKIGFKPVFLTSFLLMVPAFLLFLFLPGNWVFAGAFLAGFMNLATLPLGVTMAQTLAPKGRSMVSSIMMGLAYGLGGFTSPLIGKLADIYGIEQVLLYLSFLPLIPVFFILKFPDVKSS